MKQKKKKPIEINFLDLIPRCLIEYEISDEKLVTLLTPRFGNRLLKKLLEPRLKNRFLKIKLDEIGSAAWLLCDGTRDIKTIGRNLQERFAEQIEPCYERLDIYFRQLEGSKFICYSNLEECRMAQQQAEEAKGRESHTP